jgi:hypothetical protein
MQKVKKKDFENSLEEHQGFIQSQNQKKKKKKKVKKELVDFSLHNII